MPPILRGADVRLDNLIRPPYRAVYLYGNALKHGSGRTWNRYYDNILSDVPVHNPIRFVHPSDPKGNVLPQQGLLHRVVGLPKYLTTCNRHATG